MINEIFDDNSRLKVFAIRMLLSFWIFTYGGKGHSLRHVWLSRQVKLRHQDPSWVPSNGIFATTHYFDHRYYIHAWGNGAPAHFYLLKDAWELCYEWSFKWRFDGAIRRLDAKHGK